MRAMQAVRGAQVMQAVHVGEVMRAVQVMTGYQRTLGQLPGRLFGASYEAERARMCRRTKGTCAVPVRVPTRSGS